jgi:hypothetical protein
VKPVKIIPLIVSPVQETVYLIQKQINVFVQKDSLMTKPLLSVKNVISLVKYVLHPHQPVLNVKPIES